MIDLKPCERCGQPPAYDHTSADGVRFTCLACDDATFEDFDQAAEFWNRRPTPPPVPAISREELEAALRPFADMHRASVKPWPGEVEPRDPRPPAQHAWGFNDVTLTWGHFAFADDILSRLAAGQPPEHN